MRKPVIFCMTILLLFSSPYAVFARAGSSGPSLENAAPTTTPAADGENPGQDNLLIILPQPDELPSGKFILTPRPEVEQFLNEDTLKKADPEKWKEFQAKTGRIQGRVVAYANSFKGVYLPDVLAFYVQDFKTPEGAQLAVSQYNNVELPTGGYQYVDQSSQVGDKSLVFKKVRVIPGGDNTVYYILAVAYKNIEIQVLGAGVERYIQPEFMESMARLVIKKIAPSYPDAPSPESKRIPAGTYSVGDQIQPGLYRSPGKIGDTCYWARYKDQRKSTASIIQQRFTFGQFYVEIIKTDIVFNTTCDLEPVFNLAPASGYYPTMLDPGTYIIGKDIQAGIYKGEVGQKKSDYCFWQQNSYPNKLFSLNYEAKGFQVKVNEVNFSLETTCPLELINPFKSNTDIRVTPTPGAKPTPTVKPSPTLEPTATALSSLSNEVKLSELNLAEISADTRQQITSFLSVKQTGAVNTIAISDDGKFISTAGDNKIIHVWDLEKGQEVATLKGHKGQIRKLAFSADGQWLASTGMSKEVLLWKASTWEKDKVLAIKGNGIFIQFLPDGTLVSMDDSATIGYWDVQAGTMTKSEKVPTFINPECAGSRVTSFDMDKTGAQMTASMSCGLGVMWHQGSAENVTFATSNHQEDLPSVERPAVSSFAISADGKLGVYGMVYYGDRNLKLIDIIDLDQQTVISSVNPVDRDLTAVAIGLKNDMIFAGVAKKVYVWWPSEYKWLGENLLALEGHPGKVTAITLSGNGKVLASGDYNGNIILWGVKQ